MIRSARFDFMPTSLAGLMVVQRKPVEDGRGFLERYFCGEEWRQAGLEKSIVQINRSFTRKKGTVRGMHFQYPPHAEIKIVLCLKGEIFDVAVDIRAGSATFLRWHGEVLSAENSRSLLVPEGFAHGFQTLSDACEIIYFVTAKYAPASEGAIHPQDPSLSVQWPLTVLQLSERDSAQPYITTDFQGVLL